MSTYAASAATALNLIRRKGTNVTFTRKVQGTFDPVTQAETGGRDTTLTMPGVGLAPTKSAEFRIGSLDRRSIIELHLAPNLGATPIPGDKVRWAGADWTVIWVNALDPASDGSPYCHAYAER